MNGISLEEWQKTIGIWEKDGNILGVVNSEGEGEGEIFFQLAEIDIPEMILEEMFDFAEENTGGNRGNKRYIQMRIPAGDSKREAIAIKRGYRKANWEEWVSEIPVSRKVDITLPEGFSIVDGSNLTDFEKGRAHARAFEYINKPIYKNRAIEAYKLLRQTPDYRFDLDLYIISDTGDVVSFTTIWYDSVNKIGILEPVGTVPEYRRRGLASSVIGECIRRIEKEGAEKTYVWTNKEFYLSIGFEQKYKMNVWEKEIV
ncbi:GNAT family N-acetyltransferase [Halothermothrix orenii]|uniref:GCN5-related N-acetyltransferase n=1 Tax=Halothermothrix orenii (strain H 168 / OCM 544 / DSM 9562) TaxID=373903 RepID=B8D264_HALOH|nr:GNAT family N-acetyltransferase [Halothermothrix orenii]ACL69291.1 GCN5-related N-acetyltransferase [Halothermothrix orenii H 168]